MIDLQRMIIPFQLEGFRHILGHVRELWDNIEWVLVPGIWWVGLWGIGWGCLNSWTGLVEPRAQRLGRWVNLSQVG